MAEKEASSKQVAKWALDHVGTIITALSIITATTVGWMRFEAQWRAHVEPNCLETPTAAQCKLDRLEKKFDRLEQKVDSIILMMPKRHG
jgi:hypothetical protein